MPKGTKEDILLRTEEVGHPLPQKNINMITITASTVKDMLTILNTSKSSGPDSINPTLLKNTTKAISPSLAQLFNYSLRTASFPTNWKLARFAQIYKSRV